MFTCKKKHVVYCHNLLDRIFWSHPIFLCKTYSLIKIVSEYDQEIPKSQTADKPMAPQEEPLNHHETPGRQIKQSNPIKMIAILERT